MIFTHMDDASFHDDYWYHRSQPRYEHARSVPDELRGDSWRPSTPTRTSPVSHRTRTRSHGSQSPDQSYRYQPLRDPKNQIRLLRVQKVKDGLRGQVSIFDDDKNRPKYKALSYTWGEKNLDKHHILLRNVDHRHRERSAEGYLEITKSLCELLNHVGRYGIWSNWLWTDAICIQQQGNPKEKTHQLRMMTRIYEGARNVFAWLGPGTPSSDSGMKAIDKQSRTRFKASTRSKARPAGALSDSTFTRNTFRHDDFSRWLNKHSHEIKDIFRRQYWTRMWILQELAVSHKSATIACGNYTISWPKFVNIAMRIASCEESSWRSGLQHHVWLLALIYNKDARQLCLSKIIHLTHKAQCQHVTDTIHAVLGLVTMGNGTRLRLNSDDSTQTVLYRTIQCMLSDLRLLAKHDPTVWGKKLKRWKRQAARIREKRQFERDKFSKHITEKEAIWQECERSRSGLDLCHQLARICHEHEVLYDYKSPDGVHFDCTLTRVNRVRRVKFVSYSQSYATAYRSRFAAYSTSRRYVY